MASLESMRPQPAPANEAPPEMGEKEVQDKQLMVMMGADLMEQGGNDVIAKALEQSQDPTQVVGQVLAQVMMTLAEKGGRDMDIDPRVFLAKGGWLEDMLNYIESRFGLPKEFSDDAWYAVVEMVKASAQAGSQPAQPQGGGLEQMNSTGGPMPPQGQNMMGGPMPV